MRQFKSILFSALVISLIPPLFAQAQTFNSGSTGADGVFSPATNTVLTMPPDGVFNFTTINIPSGVSVTFNPNAANTPVTLLASGDITIAGVINVNGSTGQTRTGVIFSPGGAGGPGGFSGGDGGIGGATPIPGSAGRGPGGGSPGINGSGQTSGTYGTSTSFVSLMPLFGGSGGGGGSAFSSNGGGGGGGGGAILIASSGTITISGSITANGGSGAFVGGSQNGVSGSGGAIRLVAKTITGTGSISATSGGKIRLEAYTLSQTGSINPPASLATAPGPISAASNPSLLGGLPTLTFASIGGMTPPANPTGSTATPDVQLAAGTTNPVPISLAAANTPVGTAFSIRVIPSSGSPSTVATNPSTGTFSNSTASGNVTLQQNQVNVLMAFANFTIPQQIAALLPRIDGEEIDRLMLASRPGEGSALHFVTPSGREVPAREVVGEEMLARLWREVALGR
ncbi:MAG: hypothetical protein EPO39_07295 [Candidatus Manganitrophaceae bacterium]|nr:MAG: hypothetical protein EPO39_07295 [Candidatus Manganitrophaceae bacterium]